MNGSPAWEVQSRDLNSMAPDYVTAAFFVCAWSWKRVIFISTLLSAVPRVCYLWYSCGPLEWRQGEMESLRQVLIQAREKPQPQTRETEGQSLSDAGSQEGWRQINHPWTPNFLRRTSVFPWADHLTSSYLSSNTPPSQPCPLLEAEFPKITT